MSSQEKQCQAPIGVPKPGLKPCCACPETKKARDECMIKFGEEKCKEAIEAHKACMRAAGFVIE